jgi:outer membrane protein insertion porin family
VDLDSEDRTVRIHLNVTEGDSITVENVLFALNGAPDTGDPPVDSLLPFLNTVVQTRIHRRFRDANVDSDGAMLSRIFEDAGYPYARVSPELEVNSESRTVVIIWSVHPGPRCTFGEVRVIGARHSSSKMILESATISTGDRYSRKALEESRRRVYGLSLFHVVTVSAQLSKDAQAVIPVEIRVKEAPRLTSKFGFGYGREDKFRVYSDSYYLGFLGDARRLNLYMKHSDLEPYHFKLKLTQPAFLTSFTTLEVAPFLLRQKEPAYTENRYGGHTSLLHQFTGSLHGSVTYTFERVKLDTASLAETVSVDADLDDRYNKSSLLWGLTFTNSTPMFSPTQGNYAAASFKLSGLGLGSDYHFTRLLMDIRRYQPVLGMVVAGRLKAGGIESRDEHKFIPVEDRFYAGGSSSVRGWGRSELGPMLDETPVGGNSLMEASVELRYPIWGIVSGTVFGDFGNIWLESWSFHPDDLRYSAGMGLRVATPIGPIRVDVARPISDEETSTQVHLSVGEAF